MNHALRQAEAAVGDGRTVDSGVATGLLGLAIFLFPGVAWTLALAPRLGRARAAALSVVLAFTAAPAALFVLNAVLNLPIRPATSAFLAVALGMCALAMRAAPAVSGLRR